MRNLTPSDKKQLEFLEASPEGRHMLNKVAKSQSTKIAYSTGCKHFADYLKKGLTEIVREYQDDVKANSYAGFEKWEAVFDDFAIYLQKLGLSSASVTLYHAAAKALINANVPRSLRLQAKTPEANSRTIAGVTIDDLKEIFAMCDVRGRAIVAFLKDSGMSRADALTLNIKDLKNYEKADFVHLEVFRAKEKVEYETFIGPDAVQALRAYFTSRTIKGETLTQESPIFATDYKPYVRLNEVSLSSLFGRIEAATGKTISSHRLRKFFETYQALVVRHPIILKYWMGHKIAKSRDIESRYIIPPTPEQEKLYRESYRNICITGATLEERAQAAAKEELRKLLTPEEKQLLSDAGLRLRRREKNRENGGSQESFKQIVESELLEYLKSGWQIVKELANGQVIVKH